MNVTLTIVRIGNNPWMQVIDPTQLVPTVEKCLKEIGATEIQVETPDDHWIAIIDSKYSLKNLLAQLLHY